MAADVSEEPDASISFSTLKMEATYVPETLVYVKQPAQHHILNGGNIEAILI
jgi:hypothetical protein